MTEDVQRLHEGALSLSSAGGEARAWVRRVAQEATSVSNEANSLIAATRKAENLARKLASASGDATVQVSSVPVRPASHTWYRYWVAARIGP